MRSKIESMDSQIILSILNAILNRKLPLGTAISHGDYVIEIKENGKIQITIIKIKYPFNFQALLIMIVT